MNDYFYQDFLMDFPYDENELPIIDLDYINKVEYLIDIDEPYNLFDCINGVIRCISFKKLHNITKKEDWDKILYKVKKNDKIIIVDDLKVVNKEVLDIKNFYLKVYFFNIKKSNNNTFIYTL